MDERGRSRFDRRTLLSGLGASAVAGFAGCLGSGGDGDGNGESESESESETVEPQPVDVSDGALWRTATLEDTTTDEEYAINELDGPVLVHTFAVGCAVCAAQHDEFDQLYGTADVELVDITTDPYESETEVREHAAEEGFDWRFSVATDEVTGSLSRDFGEEIKVSASSPVILVCPNDDVYRLEKVVDAGDLESVLEEYC